ncbi:MAG: hypothetical protein WA885_20590 [Phormidesmis sp.]
MKYRHIGFAMINSLCQCAEVTQGELGGGASTDAEGETVKK